MPKPKRTTRTAKGYQRRAVDARNPRQTFLIVCEGEKTEPNYFKAFPVPTDVRVSVVGTGRNTLSLVQYAIDLRMQGDYNQVWCVFDCDDFSIQLINDAIALAQSNDMRVACSNQSFELWYLLHFHFYNTGIPRAQYIQLLHRMLGHRYTKNSQTIYQELLGRQPGAIRNARTLMAQYQPSRPAHDNPSTTVHLLVEELNRFLRPE